MKSKGKEGLFIYKDNGETLQCFGQLIEEDKLFFTIKTDINTLIIPKSEIVKVKLRNGETNGKQ